MEYSNLNRKVKKAFRLLKKGHTLTYNEGTTEFRIIDDRFEMRDLDMTNEWHPIALKDIEEEVIEVFQDQDWCFLIDQKDRIKIQFNVKFCWYDIWAGFYWDRAKSILYFCPFPMIVLCFQFKHLTVWPHSKHPDRDLDL
jgi:hypothetical protein